MARRSVGEIATHVTRRWSCAVEHVKIGSPTGVLIRLFNLNLPTAIAKACVVNSTHQPKIA